MDAESRQEMGAETEASGLVESSRPEDADEQAARLSTVEHGAAVAQDMSPPEARLEQFANHLAYGIPGGDQLGRHGNARTSLAITNPSGAVAGPPDAGQEAAPADGERLRLARELHDTIASAIAVITIQTSVADHALERCQAEPGRAREALRTIRAASLQALDELQATVTTLRGGAGARGPRPGVAGWVTSPCRSMTTGTGRQPGGRWESLEAATACSAWGSGSPPSAGGWRPGHAPA